MAMGFRLRVPTLKSSNDDPGSQPRSFELLSVAFEVSSYDMSTAVTVVIIAIGMWSSGRLVGANVMRGLCQPDYWPFRVSRPPVSVKLSLVPIWV